MNDRLRMLLEGFRRYGRRPLVGVAIVGLLSVGVAFLLPKWYRAEATLMPPQESGDSFGMLANLVEASALSKVGLLTTSSTSDLYVEILNSRRVREALIREFDLMKRYKIKNLDKCIRELDDHIKVEALRSKVIQIRVEDRDAEQAAKMANAMIAELDRVNRDLRVQRAGESRAYLEQQLAAVQNQLHEAEGRLASYERQYGVVVAGKEDAAVSGAAELLARKLALQVRRSWMESYAERDNPALVATRSELDAVDREIARLPGLKQEAARRALDVEIQRRVYVLLTAQVEQARLEENRSVSSVSVLDAARAPTLKIRPKRGVIIAIATGAALLLATAWVFVRTRRDFEPLPARP